VGRNQNSLFLDVITITLASTKSESVDVAGVSRNTVYRALKAAPAELRREDTGQPSVLSPEACGNLPWNRESRLRFLPPHGSSGEDRSN
jgi:hypothetical protein